MEYEPSEQFSINELNLLLNTIRKIESNPASINDPAAPMFRKILRTMLMIDKQKTIEFIRSMTNDNSFDIISSAFVYIIRVFQSNDLLQVMDSKTHEFKNSPLYPDFVENLQDAKDAL